MTNLEFHPETELELLESAFHYNLKVPGLGGEFGPEVKRVTGLLLEYPAVGKDAGSSPASAIRPFILEFFGVTLA